MSGKAGFFDPLWRRVAVVAICAGWTGLEFFYGENMWAGIAAAITAYAVWSFLLAYKPAGQP